MDWLLLNEMTTGEIALWHTLMLIGNRLGQKPVFNAPNTTLMKLTGLSRQGVYNARKKLVERGMIKYVEGNQHKAPVYEMMPLDEVLDVYFHFASVPKVEEATEEVTQDTTPDVTQGFTENVTPDVTPDFTQDFTQDLTIHKEKEKEKRRGGGGNAQELFSVFGMYQENIGKLTPVTADGLNGWLAVFGKEVVKEAIMITVKKGGRTFSYVETILKQWQAAGLQTLEQVVLYEAEKESEKKQKLIPFRQSSQENQEESLEEWAREAFQ